MCGGESRRSSPAFLTWNQSMGEHRTIDEVLADHNDALMRVPGVVGTAEGEQDGKPCVMVMVITLTKALRDQLPTQLEEIPIVILETGKIRAR